MIRVLKILRKKTILFIGAIVLFIGLLFTPFITKAASNDYTGTNSPEISVIDWSIGSLSKENKGVYNASYKFNIDVSIKASGDKVLKTGDKFYLELPTNSPSGTKWSVKQDTIQFEGKDASGNVIGYIQIFKAGYIEYTVAEYANGHKEIPLFKFVSSNAFLQNNYNGTDNQTVTIGDVSKVIGFKRPDINKLGEDNKNGFYPTDSTIEWHIKFGKKGIDELTEQPWGQKFTKSKYYTYLEDPLDSRFKDLGEDHNVLVQGLMFYPLSLDKNSPDYGKPSNIAEAITITNAYGLSKVPFRGDNVLTQNAGESYETFKARLKPLQYGVYKDLNGKETLIMNFGIIGDNGIKINQYPGQDYVKSAVDHAIEKGYYQDTDREELVKYFNDVYVNNVIKGHVTYYDVRFTEEYDQVIKDTEKENIAYLFNEGNDAEAGGEEGNNGGQGGNGEQGGNGGQGGSGEQEDKQIIKGKGKLVANGQASASVAKGIAKILKYDRDTNVPLAGAQFKIQYRDINDEWQDLDNNVLSPTDNSGEVATKYLNPGTYRFVETQAPNGYDLKLNNECSTYVTSNCYIEGLGVISKIFEIKSDDITGQLIQVSNIKENKEVAPLAPELDKNVACEQDYKVIINEIEGIKYTTSKDGSTVTIVASAEKGYVIKENSETTWTFDIGNPEVCDTDPSNPDPEKPGITDPEKPGTTDPNKPNPGKPGTTDPNKPGTDKPTGELKPLPNTGSENLFIVTLLTVIGLLNVVGLKYRKL